MRCRVGDLAMYVGQNKSARGKFTTVIGRCPTRADAWAIDPKLHDDTGVLRTYAADQALRPIRPDDGVDEMLRIAGKPMETPREVIKELTR